MKSAGQRIINAGIVKRAAACFLLFALAACGGPGPAPKPPYAGIKIGKPYEVYGRWYEPKYEAQYDEVGMASWYGPGFHGGHTANGERYDQDELTAAHRTLPMPSIVRVTNLDNGRSAIVKVNDRGPFARDRIIDLSRASAKKLGVIRTGTAKVRVQFLEKETREYVQNMQGGTQFAMHEMSHVDPQAVGEREEARLRPTFKVGQKMFGADTAPAAPADEFSVVEAQPAAAPQAKYIPASFAAPVPPPAAGAFLPPAGASYLIQAGTFSQEQNAFSLVNRIAGERAPKVMEIIVNGKKYYRVMMGPFSTSDDAKNMLSKLASIGISDAKIITN